jgi:hypothetical protein
MHLLCSRRAQSNWVVYYDTDAQLTAVRAAAAQ